MGSSRIEMIINAAPIIFELYKTLRLTYSLGQITLSAWMFIFSTNHGFNPFPKSRTFGTR